MKTIIANTFILLLFSSSLILKSQTLDQSQLIYNGGTSARTLPGYSVFQSFTAGITGTLVEIDMGVFNAINGVGILKVYAGADTTGALLQTTPVSILCSSGNCFTHFATSVPITSGQVYSFRFIPGAGIPDPYGVQIESPGTYAGGQFGLIDPSGVYYPGFDEVFKTYVSTSVGIVEFENPPSGITVYPNPLNASATVNFTNETKCTELGIYNLFGQKIRTITHLTSNSIQLQRDNLQAGIYLICLTENNTIIAHQKIVITD